MTRAETIAQVIAVSKQAMVDPTDFIELWVINALLDDDNHFKLLEGRLTDQQFSAIRIDQPQFEFLNEPHGIYSDNHIKVTFAGVDIYINTNAIYRLGAPVGRVDALNRCITGATWAPSDTPGFATLNVSFDGQSQYF